MQDYFLINKGTGPIVATAIHDGHGIREELKDHFKLPDMERLREEDPYTAHWAGIAPSQVIVNRSRFEVDVNRPREKAVYLSPEDAWGLEVWKNHLPTEVIENSLKQYDAFYHAVEKLLDQLIEEYGYCIIYDLHTYNYRRKGPGKAANPIENPEVNIGTKNMNREKWAPVVENLINSLQVFDFNGRHLDVRENVKFKGGYFSKWIYEKYGAQCCPLAIEFKKFFMDEWSGEVDEKQSNLIKEALKSSIPGVLSAAKSFNK